MLNFQHLTNSNKMKRLTLIILSISTIGIIDGQSQSIRKSEYPSTNKIVHTDTYGDTSITDVYHWMENLNSPALHLWMEKQETLYNQFLDDQKELIATFTTEIAERYDTEVTYAPVQRGQNTFIPVTSPGATSTKIYLLKPGSNEKELLIDLEQMGNETKTYRTVNYSPNGRFIAISESINRSRYYKVLFFDVEERKFIDDHIEGYYGGRSSITWKQDDAGFFYTQYEVPTDPQAALSQGEFKYHTIGKKQHEDLLVFKNEDQPSWIYTSSISFDNHWLVLQISTPAATGNVIMVKNLTQLKSDFVQLVHTFDDQYSFLYKNDNKLYFNTTHNAPKHRIVAIDLDNLQQIKWEEVIPESDNVITASFVAGKMLALRTNIVTKTVLNVYSLSGSFRYRLQPDASALSFSSADRSSTIAYMTAANILSPVTVYEVDLATGSYSLYSQVKLSLAPADYIFEHSEFTADDGKKVPIQLVYKKGMKKTGNAPVFLYGYGAFNWAAYPWQSYLLPWIKRGGIYAIANIRGGGVYGEQWHKAGAGKNKQRAIDDYLSAAEWLISAGYSKKGLIVANGGSASGLLPAIAINKRPDIYGAAIVDYPVIDMLRYHKFGSANWSNEFGTSDDPEMLQLIKSYSPYHNIASDHCYPPILVQVGELDVTTTPMHGYKYVAALQDAAAASCEHPMLLKIARGAGHSAGATRFEQARTQAEQFAFLYKVLGLNFIE